MRRQRRRPDGPSVRRHLDRVRRLPFRPVEDDRIRPVADRMHCRAEDRIRERVLARLAVKRKIRALTRRLQTDRRHFAAERGENARTLHRAVAGHVRLGERDTDAPSPEDGVVALAVDERFRPLAFVEPDQFLLALLDARDVHEHVGTERTALDGLLVEVDLGRVANAGEQDRPPRGHRTHHVVAVDVHRPVHDDGLRADLLEEFRHSRRGFLRDVRIAVDLLKPVELRAESRADAFLLGRPALPGGAVEIALLAESALAVRVVDDVHVVFLRQEQCRAELPREIVRMRRHDDDRLPRQSEHRQQAGKKNGSNQNRCFHFLYFSTRSGCCRTGRNTPPTTLRAMKPR